MSKDWVNDIHEMHAKFGHHEAIAKMNKETLREFLLFRIKFLQEELDELDDAYIHNNPEEVVDALIDLCVVAIGTLDAFGIDAHKAWDEVLKANMSKEAGANPTRPNAFKLPDMIKPPRWQPPSHEGNYGLLKDR